MLISIGILARNEGATIESAIISLLGQDVFRLPLEGLPNLQWEIVVVPNGCTDDTAERARRVLAERAPKTNISWSVRELTESGKSNAWNQYVHELSSPHAEVIVMLDADIHFAEQETVGNTLKALLADPEAVVAVDLPLKDAVRKPKKTLLERISLAVSKDAIAGVPGISGQFFCARAKALREIWMPKGLSVEDGFLRAMIVTDAFRSPPNEQRIIRAPDASHFYETLTSLRSIFHHELRLVMGTALNCYLAWDFLLYATDPDGPGAGILILNRVKEDPNWYAKLMANSIRNRGWWVLPRGTLFRRFLRLKEAHGVNVLKRLPIATIGFLVDVPICVVANHKLKSNSAIGYW